MSKAFTKESDDEPPDEPPEPDLVLPPGTRNYVTPAGLAAYQSELAALTAPSDAAAPAAPTTTDARTRARVARRQAALTRRLELAELVDPATQPTDRVRFGLITTVATPTGPRDYQIVGLDETDPRAGRISWQAPIARALQGAAVGDTVTVRQGAAEVDLEIVAIRRP